MDRSGVSLLQRHERELAARESSRDISGEGRTGTRGDDPRWTRDIDEICDEDMPLGIGQLDTDFIIMKF